MRGAESVDDALAGFNAVILTTNQATPGLNRATCTSPGVYVISVGVL